MKKMLHIERSSYQADIYLRQGFHVRTPSTFEIELIFLVLPKLLNQLMKHHPEFFESPIKPPD